MAFYVRTKMPQPKVKPMKHTALKATLCFAILALGTTALATPASSNYQSNGFLSCVTTSSGHLACGHAEAGICSGAGVGFADGMVHWVLIVRSHSGTGSMSMGGSPAAALATDTPCGTSDCFQAFLYADGTLVDESYVVC